MVVSVPGDNNHITVNQNVYLLARTPAVRQAVGEALRPLNDPNIDRFEVRGDGGLAAEVVTKTDLGFFTTPVAEEVVADEDGSTTRTVLAEVIKPSFQPDLKWVLSDGGGGRWNAIMKDSAFLARVQSGQRTFGKGDVIRVTVKSTPHVTAEGLRTEHEVLEVTEEFRAARQMSGLLPEPSDG